MILKGTATSSASSFSSLGCISSGPQALLTSSARIFFFIIGDGSIGLRFEQRNCTSWLPCKHACKLLLEDISFLLVGISAVESQETAKLSLETLERMRSEENSDAFFDTLKSKAEKINFIEEPSPPRKRRTPNYRTLQQYFDIQGLALKSVAYHPSDAREHNRLIYFEVLDSIISVIKERFNQPSFQAYMKMKAIDASCTKEEDGFLHEKYCGDIEVEYLETEKEVWKTIFRDSNPTCFRDIYKTTKALSSSKKLMILTFTKLCELILVCLLYTSPSPRDS